ncbi:ATP-dependent RNA helicase DHX33-like [Lutzomyia longipalpis]|uniref:ATP-dependent RNA helicase DHX33-like n=1 Tax=Lutzomyia longipalpis TaxID=7200 RepID=UPI00248404E9|nr:ATP-dependent RNA helicase DHX33-like [Lutzomyia longipalpis]XP_055684838.1 ATP-dependent RNA helicase DHX33-like [Lutzomyia longipalpis]
MNPKTNFSGNFYCGKGENGYKININVKRKLKQVLGGDGEKRFRGENGQGQRNRNTTAGPTLEEQRQSLPLFPVRQKIIQQIRENDTLIFLGETGSGKTTQIPQYVHECGLTRNGVVAVTQPRRIAAISVAQRVAQEKSCQVGDLVGYTVRFEDCTSDATRIRYMTDGTLLREAIRDRLLLVYSMIILDEAHERTVNTDVLFGIVKEAQKLRREGRKPPLKIIIMSATMDVDHFSAYFNNCKIIYLEGRTFPVKIRHVKRNEHDYVQTCLITLFDIHRNAPLDHDILIFLTGQEEIDALTEQAKSIAKSAEFHDAPMKVLPLYSQLPQHKQMEVFKPAPQGVRKVILATNIAETSLTISGIKYVIDSGVVKQKVYNTVTGMETLKVVKISQAQAWQRTGRAGRESEGFCYRAYTVSEFEKMSIMTTPEILRSNLSTTVLQLLALGIDCMNFDFMDKPSRESLNSAIKLLYELKAIASIERPTLTEAGRKMSQFPLDPRFSKILLEAPNFGCLSEMIMIIAVLSGENIFHSSTEKRDQILVAHSKFVSKFGDHLTILNAFREFLNAENPKAWCFKHFLNYRNLMYANEVRKQLMEICKRCNLNESSCGNDFDQVRRCLLVGLFGNIGELQKDQMYLTLTGRQKAKLHPSSALCHKPLADYVVYTDLVATERAYLKFITIIDSEWLHDLPNASKLRRYSTSNNFR